MRKNQRLLDLRAKKIISVPEFMVFQNFYFGNWAEFKKGKNVKALRETWKSGMSKILAFKKYEIQNGI